jgi:hypothetical protein
MRTSSIIRLSFVLSALVLISLVVLDADYVLGSCRIENISLKKEGDFTKVTVYADKPFEFSHFTEEAKDGKPYRVIIDCQDAIFDLPRNNFKTGLPAGTIKAIRTSQFQAVPQRIVRVVLDFKAPVVYKVTEPDTDCEASIAVFTARDSDFPLWVAVLEDGKDQELSREKTRPDLSRTEPVPTEEPKLDRSEISSSTREPSISQAVSDKQGAEAVEKVRTQRRAVSYADTGEKVSAAEKKAALASRSESQVRKVTRMESKSDETRHPKKTQTPEEAVTSPHLTKAAAPDKPKTAGRVEQESQTVSLPQLPPVFWGPLPQEETEKDEKVSTKKTTVANREKEETSEQTVGRIQKGIGAILGPEPAVARETMSAPDTALVIQSGMESRLSVVPQRKVVHYSPVTDRDVFLPPTEKEEMSFTEAPLPLFDNLKLVGILRDRAGNRALLEDEVGFGYILSSGERIRNGYVIAVEDDRALFHVEEYGGYQIMVLELNPEY